MSTDFTTALDECLARLQAGDSIATCLERFPEHALELQPFLETVQLAEALRFTEAPRPQALARGRQRFLTEAARLRTGQAARDRPALTKLRDFFSSAGTAAAWSRAAVAIVLVLVLFGMASRVVVQASADSLPGDPLYPVKQVTRQFQLLTTLSSEARQEKEKQIHAREREEVRQATEQGRVFEEDVAGVIVEWLGNSIVLEGGLHIRLTDATRLLGRPAAGLIADVHVRSEDGRLVAQRIGVREQPRTEVVLSATETAATQPTATTVPSETPRPTHTAEPTREPTRTPRPTHTPTPKPKATDTPFPTATADVGPSIHVFELRGTIDSISETTWVVAGQPIQITPDTVIKGQPAVGRLAHVRANRLEDGTFVALEIEIQSPNTPTPPPVTITGVVESKQSDTIWLIGGRRVRIDDRTKLEGQLRIGAFAEVEGVQESPTSLYARRITVLRACENPTLLEGRIVGLSAETWVIEVIVNVDGQDVPVPMAVSINADTQVQGTPTIGATAQVEACRTGEDTLLAQRIFVLATPTPEPTPEHTATPEPPSLQATPTVGPDATETPSSDTGEPATPTLEPSPDVTSTPPAEDVTPTATP